LLVLQLRTNNVQIVETVLGFLVDFDQETAAQGSVRPHQAEKACRLQMSKRLLEEEAAKWTVRQARPRRGASTAPALGRRVVVMKKQQTSSSTAYETAELFALAEAVPPFAAHPGLGPGVGQVAHATKAGEAACRLSPTRRPEMALHVIEKTRFAPGNGMGSGCLRSLGRGRAAGRRSGEFIRPHGIAGATFSSGCANGPTAGERRCKPLKTLD
jgi:hypothetical protein